MSLFCCLFVVAFGTTALISFNKLELQLSFSLCCQGLVSVIMGSSVGPEEQQQLPFPQLSSPLRMANSSTPLRGMLAVAVRLPVGGEPSCHPTSLSRDIFGTGTDSMRSYSPREHCEVPALLVRALLAIFMWSGSCDNT